MDVSFSKLPIDNVIKSQRVKQNIPHVVSSPNSQNTTLFLSVETVNDSTIIGAVGNPSRDKDYDPNLDTLNESEDKLELDDSLCDANYDPNLESLIVSEDILQNSMLTNLGRVRVMKMLVLFQKTPRRQNRQFQLVNAVVNVLR